MSQTCRKCGKFWCDHTEQCAQQCEEYAPPQLKFDMNIRSCVRTGGFQDDERVLAAPLKWRERVHVSVKPLTAAKVVHLT